MPSVAVSRRPTLSLPQCLLSTYQFAVLMPGTESPCPPMPSPSAAAPRMPPRPGEAVVVDLGDLVGAGADADVELQLEAGREVGVELGGAQQAEARVGDGVVDRIDVVVEPVVPVHDRPARPAHSRSARRDGCLCAPWWPRARRRAPRDRHSSCRRDRRPERPALALRRAEATRGHHQAAARALPSPVSSLPAPAGRGRGVLQFVLHRVLSPAFSKRAPKRARQAIRDSMRLRFTNPVQPLADARQAWPRRHAPLCAARYPMSDGWGCSRARLCGVAESVQADQRGGGGVLVASASSIACTKRSAACSGSGALLMDLPTTR